MNISQFINNRTLMGIFGLILLITAGCAGSVEKKIQSDIDSISARLVPDRRVAVCRITAGKGDGKSLVLRGETTNYQVKKEIIKTLDDSGIEFIDSILILPDTTSNHRYRGLVTLSVINLRKQSDHRSEMVSQSILGTPVLILKNENSWLLVQTPDNYIGWTENSSIKMMNRSEMDSWKRSERVIYTQNTGWIHDTTGSAGIVGDIVAGSILEKTGELNGYVFVKLPDGRKGCLMKTEILNFGTFCKTTIAEAGGIISFASSLKGIPYLWGGSSTKGADCSGFVQTVYFMNGLILQRDASLQALHGLPVDLLGGFSRLEEGDLLFFGSRVGQNSHVTHVAIYKGNNEYIHCSGRVMINSFDSTDYNFSRYRMNSLLSARRVIGVTDDPGIVPINKHIWY